MPDSKISDLTTATAPLAGTEVLPIVQSSSTKKVTVANLTAGRSVSAASLVATSYVWAGSGVNLAALNPKNIEFYNTAASEGAIKCTDDTSSFVSIGLTKTTARIATGNTNRLSIDATGNVTANTGNLVIGTAAKGIDFSANTNAAGMTSELLTWYEEGTFTPAYGGLSGGAIDYTTQTGRYTRIGRQVTAWFQIVVNTNTHTTGNATIAMPFAANAAGYAGSIGRNSTLRTALNHIAFFVADANVFLYDAAGGVLSATQITNSCNLSGTITYFA